VPTLILSFIFFSLFGRMAMDMLRGTLSFPGQQDDEEYMEDVEITTALKVAVGLLGIYLDISRRKWTSTSNPDHWPALAPR
jgi:hypothetical protein